MTARRAQRPLPRLDPRPVARFVTGSAAALVAVVLAGVAFAALLILVATAWPPLLAVDREVAAGLNRWVAARPLAAAVLRAVTELGGSPTAWFLLATTSAWLLIRRLPRLACYVAVTGLGAALLAPALKLLVGRARPVVEVLVAPAPGASFPSGHAVGSAVCYGVLLLVFLPAVPPRGRAPLRIAVVAVVALVGFTRMALGVHYLTDVLGGWLLGATWLGATTAAFRSWPDAAGGRPLSTGLEPAAGPALALAPESGGRTPIRSRYAAAQLTVVWLLILGAVVGTGVLVTEVLAGTVLTRFDALVVRELVELRTPLLDEASRIVSAIGGTPFIVSSAIVLGALTLAVTRRWRPLLFLGVTMLGEVALFLTASEIVGRPRPAVVPLDPSLPPTSSFPSGHVSAAISWYGALALVAAAAAGRRWRGTLFAAAALTAALVAASRVYRGVHHPTDLLGSLLLAVPWLTATWWALSPAAAARSTPETAETGRPSGKDAHGPMAPPPPGP